MKRWDERSELKITERLFLRVFLIFVVIHASCKHALRKGSTIKRSVDDLELCSARKRYQDHWIFVILICQPDLFLMSTRVLAMFLRCWNAWDGTHQKTVDPSFKPACFIRSTWVMWRPPFRLESTSPNHQLP